MKVQFPSSGFQVLPPFGSLGRVWGRPRGGWEGNQDNPGLCLVFCPLVALAHVASGPNHRGQRANRTVPGWHMAVFGTQH